MTESSGMRLSSSVSNFSTITGGNSGLKLCCVFSFFPFRAPQCSMIEELWECKLRGLGGVTDIHRKHKILVRDIKLNRHTPNLSRPCRAGINLIQ